MREIEPRHEHPQLLSFLCSKRKPRDTPSLYIAQMLAVHGISFEKLVVYKTLNFMHLKIPLLGVARVDSTNTPPFLKRTAFHARKYILLPKHEVTRGKKFLMNRKMDGHIAGILVDPKKPGPPNKTVLCRIWKDRKSSYYTLWQYPPCQGWTMEGAEFPFGRICYGEDELKNLSTPCSCSGTMKHVHRGCLARWCTEFKGVAIGEAICDLCHKPYSMQVNNAVKRREGKFLLAARQVRHLKSTEYIISSKYNRSKRNDTNTVGVLKSNFLNTEFAIYDDQLAHTGMHTSSNKVSPGLNTRCKVADIKYQFYCKSPGRFSEGMKCSLLTIPASVMHFNESALTTREPTATSFNKDDSIPFGMDLESTIQNCHAGQFQSRSSPLLKIDRPLVLKSQGMWSKTVNGWIWVFPCDRSDIMPVFSRRNGKLVAPAKEPNHFSPPVLRFGKLKTDPAGNDLYFMHYRYPLSAFQAFAMFLSSCDSKRLAQSLRGWTKSPDVWAPSGKKGATTE